MKRKILVSMAVVIGSMHAAAGSEEVLALRGTAYVEAIDTQRILVAMDSGHDGSYEHLFLYAASERLPMSPRFLNVPAELEYREGDSLLLNLAGGKIVLRFSAKAESGTGDPRTGVIRFDRTAGLVQFIPAMPLSLEDLESRRIVADCASTPASCVEAAGELLPFPH